MAVVGQAEISKRGGQKALLEQIRRIALPLRENADLDVLLEAIGDKRFVLLGEASHGTAEYYSWRTAISRRLIMEKGFSFIAVEGDWPDCYRINRHIKGAGDTGETARDVLHAFARWPTWMWANEEVLDLVEWLRDHNRGLDENRQVGFYGLDVYSLWDSLYQVMAYLRTRDPAAQEAARRAFQCFQPYGEDSQEYARATRWIDESCEDEVVRLLAAVRRSSSELSERSRELGLNAEQNAVVVQNAEHYYRTMVRGGPGSWNIRDHHMVETLERLMQHHGPAAKAIVWEHNTHIGDAQFTAMADAGMVNVGQLVRRRYTNNGVMLVGFTSYQGSVIAAREWDAPMERMDVPAARAGSWESVLHEAGAEDKLLLLKNTPLTSEMFEPRGQRAIGVVYRPESERGNYVSTVLPRRYDALLHVDTTHAVHPLHEVQQLPETFPTGI